MANEFKVKNGLVVTGPTEIIASGSYILSVDGFSGRLLQVDDGLQSGSIYSVNTVSGLPIIDVFADSTVRIGKFGEANFFISQSKVGIGKEGPLNGILDISGSVHITGSLFATASNVVGGISASVPLWTDGSTLSSSYISQVDKDLYLGPGWLQQDQGKNIYIRARFNDSDTESPGGTVAIAGGDGFNGNGGNVTINGGGTLYGSNAGNITIAPGTSTFGTDGTLTLGSGAGTILLTGTSTTVNNTLTVSPTGTFDVILGSVTENTYAQLNIKNNSNGTAASSDLVATNDTGTETGNYVDLGINSSGFTGLIGAANDAYLYTTGSNLLIGNTTTGNKSVKFFSGNNATIFPLEVSGSTIIAESIYGNVGITGSLEVSDKVVGLELPMTIDADGQIVSSTSLVDINGLSEQNLKPGRYVVDAWIFGQSSSTAGARFAISASGTVTEYQLVQTGQTSTTAMGATALVTTNDTTSTTFMTTANAECWIHIFGQIKTSTLTNITARALKVTSGNLTIRSGSFMTTTRVAN